MATRFRKSVSIAPGMKVNINKGSISASVGTKGAHYTVSSNGSTTKTVGIPGSGLSYVDRSGPSKEAPAAGKTFADRDKEVQEEQKTIDEQLIARGLCIRCGKFVGRGALDRYGYCYKCHNAVYVEKMKFWASDDSPEAGYKYEGSFPNRKLVCRYCGKPMKKKDVEERTGYCYECIDLIKTKYGPEAERRKAREEAEIEDVLRTIQINAAKEASETP